LASKFALRDNMTFTKLPPNKIKVGIETQSLMLIPNPLHISVNKSKPFNGLKLASNSAFFVSHNAFLKTYLG
jgi:hypothetical protein